jgi:hypothetical protein
MGMNPCRAAIGSYKNSGRSIDYYAVEARSAFLTQDDVPGVRADIVSRAKRIRGFVDDTDLAKPRDDGQLAH